MEGEVLLRLRPRSASPFTTNQVAEVTMMGHAAQWRQPAQGGEVVDAEGLRRDSSAMSDASLCAKT